jgi:nicotinic acid mononucleotide adenylyltransferase
MSSDNELVYLGGSFDPIHEGHYQMILVLSKIYKKVVVIPTVNYLKDKSTFSLDCRVDAMIALCNGLDNVIVLNLEKEKDTRSTYDVANFLLNKHGIKPDIAIGSDCLNTIESWIDYSAMRNEYKFFIFIRDNFFIDLGLNCVKFEIKNKNISSSDIKLNKKVDLIPEIIRNRFSF